MGTRLGFGSRVAIEATSALLWPLKPEDRITALITLLADALPEFAESEVEIDAIVDVLRMQLKLALRDSQPLQN